MRLLNTPQVPAEAWSVIRHTHPAINTTQPPATSVGKSGVLFQEVDNTPPCREGRLKRSAGEGKVLVEER